MRRLASKWIPVGLVGLAVVTAGVVFNPLSLLPSSEPEAGRSPRSTTDVLISDLVSTFEAESGSINFVQQVTVTGTQAGTIGWIADTGAMIDAGDPIYERDLQPVVLLVGDTPAWRTMAEGDVGSDVAQLEQNLELLGYGTSAEFTVDDTYTSATETIVERWQADLGVAETGTVNYGDVVFGPAGAQVGSVLAAVGDQSIGTPILTLSGEARELAFSVSAEDIGAVTPGAEVSARLPDRSTVTATVVSVAPAGTGISTVIAALADDGETELPRGDAIPVTVSWSTIVAADAITVPASALLRLDSGGYALELVDNSGNTELVPVVPGANVGTSVEILEGVDPQARIIAP